MRAESVKAGSHSITTKAPSPEATPAPPSASAIRSPACSLSPSATRAMICKYPKPPPRLTPASSPISKTGSASGPRPARSAPLRLQSAHETSRSAPTRIRVRFGRILGGAGRAERSRLGPLRRHHDHPGSTRSTRESIPKQRRRGHRRGPEGEPAPGNGAASPSRCTVSHVRRKTSPRWPTSPARTPSPRRLDAASTPRWPSLSSASARLAIEWTGQVTPDSRSREGAALGLAFRTRAQRERGQAPCSSAGAPAW